jgi:hypothetical protein
MASSATGYCQPYHLASSDSTKHLHCMQLKEMNLFPDKNKNMLQLPSAEKPFQDNE